jgi:DNA-binding NarL/FixJ family response regulator
MTLSIQLSEKQIKIIQLIASGLTKKEIADKIGTSEKNVSRITYQLTELFDCRNSAGLVNFAWENGILKKPSS